MTTCFNPFKINSDLLIEVFNFLGSFNASTNGPIDAQPSNVIQRGGGGESSSSSIGRGTGGGGGGRGHVGYTMENGIDFRTAAQQQQQQQQSMMGHQSGALQDNRSSSGMAR